MKKLNVMESSSRQKERETGIPVPFTVGSGEPAAFQEGSGRRVYLFRVMFSARSEMVGCGSDQSRRVIETAGVAGLR